MSNKLKDYKTSELADELNRRLALDAKKMYETRTALTNHIRRNISVYNELADIMENSELKDTLKKIEDLTYGCIDMTLTIRNGKEFIEAIMDENSQPVWAKYTAE